MKGKIARKREMRVAEEGKKGIKRRENVILIFLNMTVAFNVLQKSKA